MKPFCTRAKSTAALRPYITARKAHMCQISYSMTVCLSKTSLYGCTRHFVSSAAQHGQRLEIIMLRYTNARSGSPGEPLLVCICITLARSQGNLQILARQMGSLGSNNM